MNSLGISYGGLEHLSKSEKERKGKREREREGVCVCVNYTKLTMLRVI